MRYTTLLPIFYFIWQWLEANPNAIHTGVAMLDQTIGVLLQTSMFLGGLIGLILDNTIPGRSEKGCP